MNQRQLFCGSQNSFSGFSLLEILIALGIFAGIAMTLMTQVTWSSALGFTDAKILTATTLAQNKMSQLLTDIDAEVKKGKFADDKEESGVFESPNEAFKFAIQIRKVEVPLGDGGAENAQVASALAVVSKDFSKSVREAKVKVFWYADEKEDPEQQVELVTHVVKLMP